MKMVLVPEPYRKVLTGPLKGLVVQVLKTKKDNVLVHSRWSALDCSYCPGGVEILFAAEDLERYEIPEGFTDDRSAEFNRYVKERLTALLEKDRIIPGLPPSDYREVVVFSHQIKGGDWILLPNSEWHHVDCTFHGLWHGEPRVLGLLKSGAFFNHYYDEQVKVLRP